METQIIFINKHNQDRYGKKVLDWLEKDFYQKKKPTRHFWHNAGTIDERFNTKDSALVAVDHNDNVLGYMVWDKGNIEAEIDIVEVKKQYQKRGIMKKMFFEFCNRYPEVSVLTAIVIPESKEIFRKMGFVSKIVYGKEKFYKILKMSSLIPVNKLPDGHAIGISSEEVHKVRMERERYEDTINYYKISLTDTNALLDPIIVSQFNYENYVCFYFNKKLIAAGRISYILDNKVTIPSLNLLIIDKIIPTEDVLSDFYNLGFLQASQEDSESASENFSSSEEKSSSSDSALSLNTNNNNFLQKRKRGANENSNESQSDLNLIEAKQLPIVKKQKTTHGSFFSADINNGSENKDIDPVKSDKFDLNKHQPTL